MKYKKIISVCVVAVFLLGSLTNSNFAYGNDGLGTNLGIASSNNDILGMKRVDINRLRIIVDLDMAQLITPEVKEEAVSFLGLIRGLEEKVINDQYLYEDDEIHPFYHEAKITEEGISVIFRIKDGDEVRDYDIVFSFKDDSEKGYKVVAIYSEGKLVFKENYEATLEQQFAIDNQYPLLGGLDQSLSPEILKIVKLAEEVGLELDQQDISDLENPFFQNVTTHILKTAKALELDRDVLNTIYKPEKVTEIEIPVTLDSGEVRIFKGYRIMHSNARGAGKGGIRFHPTVDRGLVRALSTDMTWKDAIVGIPYGGGKGGIQVDPKKHSPEEMEQLCRGYIREILKKDPNAIGVLIDVPAPDVGTTKQHMAWMRDEYEKITGKPAPGIVTGKPVEEGGSKGREKATGQGVFFATRTAIKTFGEKLGIGTDITKCSYAFQGAGNVSFEAIKIFFKNGCKKIQYISDVSGCLNFKDGLTQEILDALEKHIDFSKPEKERGLLKDFQYEGVEYLDRDALLTVKVDVLVPAALQNQITKENANDIQARLIVEGANGPTTPEADEILAEKGIIVIPDVLANTGGVTVSYYEWLQNIQDEKWELISVDKMLEYRMMTAFEHVHKTAEVYGVTMRKAAMLMSFMRVVDAEVARNEVYSKRFKKIKPYKAIEDLSIPETFEQLNHIVEDHKFRELIASLEEKKHEELIETVDDIVKRFDGKNGAILIDGPNVGKAIYSYNLKRELKSRGITAKVVNLDNQSVDDIARLLNGGTISINPEDQYYASSDETTLSLGEGEVLILEGEHAFREQISKLLQKKERDIYRIFVNTAPCMKLADNYPFTSLHARMLREIINDFFVKNKRPSETLLKFLRKNKVDIKKLYPRWVLADRSVEVFQPYELPILKREIWDELLKDIETVENELATSKEENEDNSLTSEMKEVFVAMKKLRDILEPIKPAGDHVILPETAILRQYIRRDRRDGEQKNPRDEEISSNILQEIETKVSQGYEAGVELARPVLDKPYTLFTAFNIFKNEKEFEFDKVHYASRFHLEEIKSNNPKNIVNRVLDGIKSKGLDPNKVIVQLPGSFSQKESKTELDRLLKEAPGIKFIIMETEGLKKEQDRRQYRRDLYSIMLLARRINDDISVGSPIYAVLSFMIKTHMNEDEVGAVNAYVNALKDNDVDGIIKTTLLYKPADKYDVPEYGAVSAALVSA